MDVTIAETWTLILTGASAIVLLNNAWKAISGFIRKLRQPDADQDEQIQALTVRMNGVDVKLARDKTRLDDIDSSNQIMLEGIYALLGHALHGNNIKQMEEAEDDLKNFLIGKKGAHQ